MTKKTIIEEIKELQSCVYEHLDKLFEYDKNKTANEISEEMVKAVVKSGSEGGIFSHVVDGERYDVSITKRKGE